MRFAFILLLALITFQAAAQQRDFTITTDAPCNLIMTAPPSTAIEQNWLAKELTWINSLPNSLQIRDDERTFVIREDQIGSLVNDQIGFSSLPPHTLADLINYLEISKAPCLVTGGGGSGDSTNIYNSDGTTTDPIRFVELQDGIIIADTTDVIEALLLGDVFGLTAGAAVYFNDPSLPGDQSANMFVVDGTPFLGFPSAFASMQVADTLNQRAQNSFRFNQPLNQVESYVQAEVVGSTNAATVLQTDAVDGQGQIFINSQVAGLGNSLVNIRSSTQNPAAQNQITLSLDEDANPATYKQIMLDKDYVWFGSDIATNTYYRFPLTRGADGDVLKSDAIGNLSWQPGGVADNFYTANGTITPAFGNRLINGNSNDINFAGHADFRIQSLDPSLVQNYFSTEIFGNPIESFFRSNAQLSTSNATIRADHFTTEAEIQLNAGGPNPNIRMSADLDVANEAGIIIDYNLVTFDYESVGLNKTPLTVGQNINVLGSTNLALNDNQIRLRNDADGNHFISYLGGAIDGVVIQGAQQSVIRSVNRDLGIFVDYNPGNNDWPGLYTGFPYAGGQTGGSFAESVRLVRGRNGDGTLEFLNNGLGRVGGSNGLAFWSNGNADIDDNPAMILLQDGRLGIGTINPRGLVEISGNRIYDGGAFTFYALGGQGGGAGAVDFSLWCTNRVGASEFNAYSDERIKDVVGKSDSEADLQTLLDIEIVDYKLKDDQENAEKKVIGQQLEKVFPQAVRKTKNVISDIMKTARITNGIVNLKTSLKPGDVVAIIHENDEYVEYEVMAATRKKFTIDYPHSGQVFVYGRQVDDFILVDYTEISMLNVSATQALYARIAELERQIKKLKHGN